MRARIMLTCLAVLSALAGQQAPALGQSPTQNASQNAPQTCSSDDVAAIVDDTGAKLRQHNSESQPRLRAKLRELAQKRGWTSAEVESKGLAVLQDDQTVTLDGQAGQLLMRLDQLGDASKAQGPTCQRLEEARVAAAQLVEVTRERSTHVLARLDAALQATGPPATVTPPPVAAAPVAPPPLRPEARPSRPPQQPAAPQETASVVRPKPSAPSSPAPSSSAPGAPAAGAWGAKTIHEAQPSPAAMAELPRPIDPGDLGFTPADIRAAGTGIFGSISAELAAVIDFAFTQFGRPTGYVLGQEGGGAFLAGLRYGEGTLVTKLGGEQKVYWQGPSVGYDFGLAGSQVMFLVYNVTDAQQLYNRFAGVDGSAYLVGGVGITFLKKGPIVLAPIRTGLGLRVGANIGYLKFTPTPSLNPF